MSMTYIGPEKDHSYIQFWKQYQDPVDINSKIVPPNPSWLRVFEAPIAQNDTNEDGLLFPRYRIPGKH